MKKYIIITAVIIVMITLGLIYKQSHISITGFNVSKSELNDVLIYTNEHQYMVTDSKLVLELSNEISKMDKYSKIESSNFPPSKEQPSKFIKIEVQTKNKGTIGGSFWDDSNNIILDSNGYYWMATKDLFDLMEKSLKDAKIFN